MKITMENIVKGACFSGLEYGALTIKNDPNLMSCTVTQLLEALIREEEALWKEKCRTAHAQDARILKAACTDYLNENGGTKHMSMSDRVLDGCGSDGITMEEYLRTKTLDGMVCGTKIVRENPQMLALEFRDFLTVVEKIEDQGWEVFGKDVYAEDAKKIKMACEAFLNESGGASCTTPPDETNTRRRSSYVQTPVI